MVRFFLPLLLIPFLTFSQPKERPYTGKIQPSYWCQPHNRGVYFLLHAGLQYEDSDGNTGNWMRVNDKIIVSFPSTKKPDITYRLIARTFPGQKNYNIFVVRKGVEFMLCSYLSPYPDKNYVENE